MNQYFEETILNADPIDLIRLLYHRAISSVTEAREHLRERRIAQRSAAILQAYSVLTELIASLRPDAAPDMAKQLRCLYLYVQKLLVEANMRQADEPLAEALSLLATLQEAWSAVAENLSREEASGGHAWRAMTKPPAGRERIAVHA